MVEKDKHEPDKESFMKRLQEKAKLKQGVGFFKKRHIEIAAGVLVLAGIILSFFYPHIGGMLVGLGFGICFFEEIQNYFYQLSDLYTEQGLFKTLIWIATILYFLISIPAFIIAAVVGFGVIYLIRRLLMMK